VRVGKKHPFGCQSVDMRSRHLGVLGVVAVDIAVADIVRQYDDDVWPQRCVGSSGKATGESNDESACLGGQSELHDHGDHESDSFHGVGSFKRAWETLGTLE